MIRHWDPSIGDPTPVGWITVVAYFLAAGLLVYQVAISQRLYGSPLRGHLVILVVAFGLVTFLGINKQLDLQSWFTDVGRDISKDQGWYEGRRPVQIAFVLLLAVISISMLVGAFVFLRKSIGSHLLMIIGLTLLCGFVVARATSFHWMDSLIGSETAGIEVNWILELGGIFLVVIGSIFSILRGLRQSSELEIPDPSEARPSSQSPPPPQSPVPPPREDTGFTF